MDEPTAALSAAETERLFEIVHGLRAAGVSVVYISHRLEEIQRLADRVTVLRDGTYVGTYPMEAVDVEFLVRAMVGRELKEKFPVHHAQRGGV